MRLLLFIGLFFVLAQISKANEPIQGSWISTTGQVYEDFPFSQYFNELLKINENNFTRTVFVGEQNVTESYKYEFISPGIIKVISENNETFEAQYSISDHNLIICIASICTSYNPTSITAPSGQGLHALPKFAMNIWTQYNNENTYQQLDPDVTSTYLHNDFNNVFPAMCFIPIFSDDNSAYVVRFDNYLFNSNVELISSYSGALILEYVQFDTLETVLISTSSITTLDNMLEIKGIHNNNKIYAKISFTEY